ncbi:MAG: HNH endonuclease signature motif containing protein [Nitrosomonadaceae bacterium]
MSKNKCSVDSCDRLSRTKGMCDKHYRYHKIHGTTELIIKTQSERFKEKCEKVTESGCIIWICSTDKNGYGTTQYNGKVTYAHRAAYIEKNGEIPNGLEIDHLCRVRSCVNPDHLEAVTHKENCNRSISHNTLKTHCPEGHPYSGDNLYFYKKGNKRDCKACARERDKKYSLNKRLGGYSHQ